MSGEAHGSELNRLPETLPIFPLSGVLLLPRGQLPLNVFEPRYLEMVEHALGADRQIGMVQPVAPETDAPRPEVYETGCAGRISEFSETDDGRYLITLVGVCRFRILEELAVETLYRRARVTFAPYIGDLDEEADAGIDRERLFTALRAYMRHEDNEINWGAIEKLDDAALVTTLAMACPFEAAEKQALLQAQDLWERAVALTALIEMAALQTAAGIDVPNQ